MGDYYAAHLSAERLQQCYELASPRVRQYLEAELAFVVSRLRPSDAVLELGCGYGRILRRLAANARLVVGIDTSPTSVQLGRELLRDVANCQLLQMDAAALGFVDESFNVVVCIQNGISAFKIQPHRLLAECLRVTRPGGRVLLSSYAAKFWPHRLEWFRLQAEHGLLGEIDWSATRDGVIVCQDGFKATTTDPEAFRALAADLGVECQIEEVDESSVFCEITV
jgi:2-polyprenyl-6-hydroxyphenyl methylase/3-demethylubiquinone-9 3-methyltransferase